MLGHDNTIAAMSLRHPTIIFERLQQQQRNIWQSIVFSSELFLNVSNCITQTFEREMFPWDNIIVSFHILLLSSKLLSPD